MRVTGHGVEGCVKDGQIRSAWAVTTTVVPAARMSARSWLRDVQSNDVVAITVWIVLIWPAWRAPKWSQRSFGVT